MVAGYNTSENYVSRTLSLKFHPDKCKHMHISRHNPDDSYIFLLMEKEMEFIKEEEDIGVIVDSELTFDLYICENKKEEEKGKFHVRSYS